MRYSDQTAMGGAQEAFLTTHWSLIEDIKARPEQNTALIGLLLETYWKPVYCYLRRRGYHNEQAKDLTQDFFHEVVLNRQLLGRADQDKGRFRSFLLHALKQYTINKERDVRAQKRIPRDKIISLDLVNLPDLPQEFTQATADDSFHYAWLSTLLERVIADVRQACQEQGMEVHWDLFNERVVQPLLEGSAPPSLTALCEKHGVVEEKKGSNMIVTMKRRFRSTLMRHVSNTVASKEQVSTEMEELLKFLPQTAQPQQKSGE
jgi:DNA-directed RNA polymerase specialized sigma24 family protein